MQLADRKNGLGVSAIARKYGIGRNHVMLVFRDAGVLQPTHWNKERLDKLDALVASGMAFTEYITEQTATAHYDVISNGLFPHRIGHISGARRVYLAEQGCVSLGYFKTRQAAKKAIVTEFNKPDFIEA